MRAESKKEIIFHIGSDKAGSTAIQVHAYALREFLITKGVYIPLTGLGEDCGHAFLFQPLTQDILQNLVEEINTQNGFSRFLITWEGIHFLEEKTLKLLASVFSDFTVKIIYYVREQADIIQSGLLQEIKEDLRRVFFDEERKHEDLPDNRNYYKTIKLWQSVFKNLETEIIYFDRQDFKNGNIVYDFFERVGCSTEDITVSDRTINHSLDVPSAELICKIEGIFLQNHDRWCSTKRRQFIDLLLLDIATKDKKGSLYYLSKTEVERIRKHYYSYNKKLVKEFGVSAKLIDSKKAVWKIDDNFQQITDDAITIMARISPLLSYNVLHESFTNASGKEVKPILSKGWFDIEPWGAWCKGQESTISGRLLFQELRPNIEFLRFRIHGRYLNQKDKISEVYLNGNFLGEMDLTDCFIKYPISKLKAPYVVSLTLKHPRLYKPSDVLNANHDTRELSYGIEKICTEYL